MNLVIKEIAGPAGAPAPPDGVPLLDLARQHAPIAGEISAAVEAVLASQHFILGEQVARFEQEAAAALGAGFAVGCASGTDALWLALAALGIGPGDAVVTTPFSFFASASAILRAGARPLFADIDPLTFNLSAVEAERLLAHRGRERVRAILPVHLYGQCADWDAFERLRQTFGLVLVEDAAQAWGAEWRGRPAGTLGDAAAFSFYPTKNLSAAGDAGMVSTGAEPIAARARMLRVHGMRQRYHHEEVGWNSRLDTLQAAILLVKLGYIGRWNEERRRLAAGYDRLFRERGLAEAAAPPAPEGGTADAPAHVPALSGNRVLLPGEAAGARHCWHQYVLRAPRRDELRAFLTSRRIGTEIYYPLPLHLQPALAGLGYRAGDFPLAERAAREVLALPLFPGLRAEEQELVVDTIAEFLR